MKTLHMMQIAIAVAVVAPAALAEPTVREVAAIHQRDFHDKGQAKVAWAVQDAVQRVCTQTDNNPPEDLAKAMEGDELKRIPIPAGNLIGDWKKGAKIASSGKGKTWKDNPKKPGGGGCYNCHELSPKQVSFGTIGPSLKGFGKLRGTGAETQKYTYGKIWNAKAYSLCSHMPRFGHSGSLTAAQIRDVVGYLLDPASPVNK